ncbi:N-alpha-acetyltransferase 30 [Binucleata daphniae]
MLITFQKISDYNELNDIAILFETYLSESYSFFLYTLFYTKYNDHCFTAKLGNKIVGAIFAKIEENGFGYIGLFAVDQNYRQKGIGTKLITACLQSFLVNNISIIVLETESNNTAAIHLYEKIGFIKTDYYDRYYLDGKDAYRLQFSYLYN